MKTPQKNRTAFRAWAASLPVALLVPFAIWVTLGIWPKGELILFTILIGAVALMVHLVSYLIVGLPLFLTQFPKPHSLLWVAPIALPMGTILGSFASFIFFTTVYPTSNSFSYWVYLLGAGYGFITAIAAFGQRPKRFTEI